MEHIDRNIGGKYSRKKMIHWFGLGTHQLNTLTIWVTKP
jgi:hypothetical protein